MIFFRKLILGAARLLPLFILCILYSCQKDPNSKSLSPLESRGRGIYIANCIACHNPDPRIDGSLGPAIAFSDLPLLEARVLSKSYPPGYKPKRKSELMPNFPHLKDNIPGLHAYLNSFTK